jgi:hypothetical protein
MLSKNLASGSKLMFDVGAIVGLMESDYIAGLRYYEVAREVSTVMGADGMVYLDGVYFYDAKDNPVQFFVNPDDAPLAHPLQVRHKSAERFVFYEDGGLIINSNMFSEEV